MHAIRIDRDKPLAAEPHSGHNRYHPDIAPVVEIGEGEEIALETRDAVDGQIKPSVSNHPKQIVVNLVSSHTTFCPDARPGDARRTGRKAGVLDPRR
jgi:formamidase